MGNIFSVAACCIFVANPDLSIGCDILELVLQLHGSLNLRGWPTSGRLEGFALILFLGYVDFCCSNQPICEIVRCHIIIRPFVSTNFIQQKL